MEKGNLGSMVGAQRILGRKLEDQGRLAVSELVSVGRHVRGQIGTAVETRTHEVAVCDQSRPGVLGRHVARERIAGRYLWRAVAKDELEQVRVELGSEPAVIPRRREERS